VRGAALAWLLAFPLCYALGFRLVLHAIGLRLRHALSATAGPAAAAAIMAVAVWFLDVRTGTHAAIDQSVRIVAGALAYGLLLRLVDREAFRIARTRLAQLAGLRRTAAIR